MLIQYFTRPPVVIPQNQDKHYKFKVGDRVRLPLTKAQRQTIGFKWSLHKGWNQYFINRTVVTKKYILCKGGFSNLIGTIQDRQLTSTKNNILVPFYTVIVSGGQNVYESYAVMPSKPIS